MHMRNAVCHVREGPVFCYEFCVQPDDQGTSEREREHFSTHMNRHSHTNNKCTLNKNSPSCVCLCICSSGSSKISSIFPRVHNFSFDPFSLGYASLQSALALSRFLLRALPFFIFIVSFLIVIHLGHLFLLPDAAASAVVANRIHISSFIVRTTQSARFMSARVRKLSVFRVLQLLCMRARRACIFLTVVSIILMKREQFVCKPQNIQFRSFVFCFSQYSHTLTDSDSHMLCNQDCIVCCFSYH